MATYSGRIVISFITAIKNTASQKIYIVLLNNNSDIIYNNKEEYNRNNKKNK